MKTNKLILAFVLLAFGLFSCQSLENEENITIPENESEVFISKAQFQQAEMRLVKATARSFETGVQCTGNVDAPPSNRAVISALWGGVVEKNNLIVGDQVKQGQRLLAIKNPSFIDLQQAFLSAKAEAIFLEGEFKRQKQLQDEKINSIQKFAETENKLLQAQANYQSLKEKLKLLGVDTENLSAENIKSSFDIYSPINGRVSKVFASLGKYVNREDAIMEIIDDSHLHLELNVFEKDLQALEKGQKIRFQVPESSGKNLFGDVHLIGNTIDEETRTVKVHGHIDLEQANFAVGMFIEAFIITQEDSLLSLPKEAVFVEEGNSFVLIKKGNKEEGFQFVKKQVSILAEQADYVGLAKDDQWDDNAEILLGAYHLLGGGESEH